MTGLDTEWNSAIQKSFTSRSSTSSFLMLHLTENKCNKHIPEAQIPSKTKTTTLLTRFFINDWQLFKMQNIE